MAVATNSAQMKSGYNNLQIGFITPDVDADGVRFSNDATYPAAGSIFAQFLTSALKIDTINEITSAAGVTIDGVLVKDGGVRLANAAYLAARNAANSADVSIARLNSSDLFEFHSDLNLSWGTFTPSAYGGAGSLTFGSVTPSNNFYFQIGDFLYFHLRATGTTGGTTSSELSFTLPVGFTLQATNLEIGCTVFENSGFAKPGRCYAQSTTVMRVHKGDVSDFFLGANTGFIVQGLVRLA